MCVWEVKMRTVCIHISGLLVLAASDERCESWMEEKIRKRDPSPSMSQNVENETTK